MNFPKVIVFQVSIASRSVARSRDRSIARSLGRSIGRSVARSLDRSVARSVARSLDRLIDRSIWLRFPGYRGDLSKFNKQVYLRRGLGMAIFWRDLVALPLL